MVLLRESGEKDRTVNEQEFKKDRFLFRTLDKISDAEQEEMYRLSCHIYEFLKNWRKRSLFIKKRENISVANKQSILCNHSQTEGRWHSLH